MATGKSPGIQVPVSWVGAEDIPITFINNWLGQVDDKGDATIMFGHYTPPPLVGTPEEILAQAERIAYIPCHPVARFTLSRPRLFELAEALQKILDVQQTVREQLRQSGLGDRL